MVDQDLIAMGLGEKKANLVIKNGTLVNVITGETYKADVAVGKDRVVAIGDVSRSVDGSTKVVDANDYFVVPGLIDGHIHIEVSKLSVSRFAEAVLPRGTTSVMTGLDQIAVTNGLKGMRAFLDEAKETHLKVFNAAASKLPYTLPPSTIGFGLGPNEHAEAQKWTEALGTWETTIDFVLAREEDVYKAIDLAHQNRLLAHGHSPLATGPRLAGFLTVGIRSDHESFSKDEALEKIRNGLYVIIREAPVAHNLPEIIKIVTEAKVNPRRVCLCTDDVNVLTLLNEGHVDNVVRKTIELGVDPIVAVQMATINTAEAYRVDHIVGSISPGKLADILLVENLRKFSVKRVFANGEPVAENGEMVKQYKPPPRPEWLLKTFKIPMVHPSEIAVRSTYDSKRVRAISMNVPPDIPLRFKREVTLEVNDGVVKPNLNEDVLLVTVAERFSGKGQKATAFISGFNLKNGAIATSLSPDDNNIICIGTNQEEVAFGINYVAQIGGGQVVVKGGKVLAELRLPIAGICTDLSPTEVAQLEQKLDDAARDLGSNLKLPIMFMIFLPITAIPEYALTDKGLVESATQRFVDPVVGPA